MRATGRLPKVLYFINGMVPTESEQSDADALAATGKQVCIRNAQLVDGFGAAALEECDDVAGNVPERYKNAFQGGAVDNVSGVGALRVIHDGEPGVSDTNALHLRSIPTGDFVEEDRRRAYKGVAPTEWGGGVSMDSTIAGKATKPDDSAPGGSTNQDQGGIPLPGSGWKTFGAGEPGAANIPASVAAAKITGDEQLVGAGKSDNGTVDASKITGSAAAGRDNGTDTAEKPAVPGFTSSAPAAAPAPSGE